MLFTRIEIGITHELTIAATAILPISVSVLVSPNLSVLLYAEQLNHGLPSEAKREKLKKINIK